MTDAAPGATLGATPVTAGSAAGRPVLLVEPLSFWGGYDAETGAVTDRGHPQHGQRLAGCVLLMDRAKGSSSSSSVLAQAIRNATAPAAIVMRERDLIVALGSLVAAELYAIRMPVVVADADAWRALAGLPAGCTVRVWADGPAAAISVEPAG